MRTTRFARVGLILVVALAVEVPLAAASGELDDRFARRGALIGTSTETAGPLTREADGRLLIVSARRCGSRCADLTIARRNAFGGKVGEVGSIRATAKPDAIAAMRDGAVVVGAVEGALVLSRVTRALKPDPRFGTGGSLTVSLPVGIEPTVAGAVGLPDGGTIVAGTARVGARRYVLLTRHLADGELDRSFGGGGVVATVAGATGDAEALGIDLAPDGGVLVVGYGTVGSTRRLLIAKYRQDGRPDASFGDGGAVLTDAPGTGAETATAIARLADGRLVVAGQASQGGSVRIVMARYFSNGTLDVTFGSSGTTGLTLARTTLRSLAGIVAQPGDGVLVIANVALPSRIRGLAVARLDEDGRIDRRVGRDGVATIPTLDDGRVGALEGASVAGTPFGDAFVRGVGRARVPVPFLVRITA